MAPRPTTSRPRPTRPRHSTALILVDQRPIQRHAWAEFHRAQKLQDKAARDLHRHEITDTPAYERWLHAAFPSLVTNARDLHARVESLTREVEAVQDMAALTGRSLKKLWREHQEYLANPEAFERKAAAAEAKARSARDAFFTDNDTEEDEDSFFNDLFGDDNEDDDFGFHGEGAEHPTRLTRATRPAPAAAARDLYRRLVQRLHPDRGGEWTPARERLWHEVQQAWATRDTDWLARLDIEWETAHDVINENSSIGRLRQAIRELHAAHRDTERKLRAYRQTPAWRFTLSEKKRPQLHRRTEADLRHDIDVLQRQLDYLQKTIAAWEEPIPSRKPHRSGRGKQPRTRL